MRTGTELQAVVLDRDEVADGVARLTLSGRDGAALPSWRPGSHATLLLPDGVERQYSLCGDTLAPGTWTFAVLREAAGRGGSAWIHENLVPGTAIEVRGPENHFALGRATRYEFVAGGIGITPLLSMIATVDARGADWRLRYAGRSRAGMAFLDRLLELHPSRVEVYAADEGDRLDVPAAFGTPGADGTHVYACGPASLLDELAAVLAGRPGDALHQERFEPVELTDPVRAEAFEVELLFTGTTITVQPGESILEAAERAGAPVLSSCREGPCGTCETIVTEGGIDHRDGVLSPGERARHDRMMICVSRATGPRLTLEL